MVTLHDKGVIDMWNLTPADAERAKHNLELRRAAILNRHAEEIRGLEGEQAEIETFVRVAEAFAQKFKNQTEPAPAESTGADPEDATKSETANNTGDPQSPTGLKVHYNRSPNFGDLARRIAS